MISRRMPYKSLGLKALLVGLIAALVLPIMSILWGVFDPDWTPWFRLWETTLPGYIINTIALMVLVGGISCIVGVSCAWFVTAYEFPGRKWLSWALVLPIAAPAYIIAYVYADLLEFYGPVQSGLRSVFGWKPGDYIFPSIRNLAGASLVLGFVLYPYVYLLARASFLSQSQSQLWAARTLGLSRRSAFIRIVLPSSRPAIAGGVSLVLMETLADFGVADFFSVSTFSVGIFRNWLVVGDKAAAMKLASLMLLAVFVLVVFESNNRKGLVATSGRTTAQSQPMKLYGAKAVTMTLFCVMPVLIGLVIPMLRLIYHSLAGGDLFQIGRLAVYFKNSLSLALIVGVILMTMALTLAYIKRRNSTGIARTGIRLATLGYALPGALLAVGLLAPLSWVDHGLTKGLVSLIGWDGGLVLTGTVIALIYALSIRFLTVAFNSIDAGFSKISASLDYSARSLNALLAKRIRYIFLPLLKPSLLSAFILIFIDVMRELPATLIMRPFNFDTLATRVYWLASDERLSEASTAALTIVMAGLLPTYYLNRFIAREKV